MGRKGPKRLNRREALRAAAAAGGVVAAPWLVPASALGSQGSVAAGDRITLGFIGIGAMGQGHLRCFVEYPDAQVVAVCDVDRWRRENAKVRVEELYAARSAGGSFRGCAAYTDLRELLARDDVDAVVIATGDNWHAPATVMAARAGKDIYCEKPISKTIREARAMADAVRRYDRVFQAGLQQRSTPEFIKACSLVRGGRIGRVTHVYVGFPGSNADVNLAPEPVPDGLDWDLWLGPAPWRPFNGRFHRCGPPPRVVPWDFCRDFGGGNLTSNAVHAFDVVQWGLGADDGGPMEIVPPETGEVPSLTYHYPDGAVVQTTWRLDPAKHFVPEGWDVSTRLQPFGALFVGEEGWIHVGREGYLKSYPGEIVQGPAGESDPFRPVGNHHQDWLACIRSRQRPACDVETGCRSTTVSHLGCIAHWTGRAQRWDPGAEEFVGDEEANRLRGRVMREPWRV
jgi:predicted dehydrogenase